MLLRCCMIYYRSDRMSQARTIDQAHAFAVEWKQGAMSTQRISTLRDCSQQAVSPDHRTVRMKANHSASLYRAWWEHSQETAGYGHFHGPNITRTYNEHKMFNRKGLPVHYSTQILPTRRLGCRSLGAVGEVAAQIHSSWMSKRDQG